MRNTGDLLKLDIEKDQGTCHLKNIGLWNPILQPVINDNELQKGFRSLENQHVRELINENWKKEDKE